MVDIITAYEDLLTHDKLKPIPKSQKRCLNPVKKWNQSPHSEPNKINRPIEEFIYELNMLKLAWPKAIVRNHKINNNKPKKSTIPVMRCIIESIEFNCGLYIVKWGERGRFLGSLIIFILNFSSCLNYLARIWFRIKTKFRTTLTTMIVFVIKEVYFYEDKYEIKFSIKRINS